LILNMPYSVRGEPFLRLRSGHSEKTPFALRLSKGERFAQDRTMNGITTQPLGGRGFTLLNMNYLKGGSLFHQGGE